MRAWFAKPPRTALAVFCISALLLLIGFYWNAWGAVPAGDMFENWLHDTEAIAMGRLAFSRETSVWTSAGLLGEYQDSPTSQPKTEVQYERYLQGGQGLVYEPYRSQIGFQVLLLGLVDKALALPAPQSLGVLRFISAVLSAQGLAALVAWFYVEFGGLAALGVLGAMLTSLWLTLFGRNVFWMLWAFYVPMLLLAFALYREDANRPYTGWLLFGLAWMGLVIKCLFNGYEFISTALVMTMVPLIYYALKDRWPIRKTLMRLGVASAGAITGVLTTFVILILQMAQLTGDLSSGIDYLAYSFVKRTSGVPGLQETHLPGLEFNIPSILWQYLISTATILKWLPGVRFVYLIGLFLLVTAMFVGLYRWGVFGQAANWKTLALAEATWVSILAPLSWFVLFLQHAYVHVYMDNVIWYMPFVLFGFGLCGAVAAELIRVGLNRWRPDSLHAK